MSSSAVATADEEAVEPAGKPSSKRKLILIASAVIFLVVAAAGAWFSGLLHHHGTSAARLQLASIAEKPSLLDVPDIVTNLDNGSRRAVFIKLKAKIEVAHLSDQATVNAEMPQILDAFQTYLRSLRPEELHGGEGIYRLREAMINRIDVLSAPVQVMDILFVEMLIQ